VQGEGLQRLVMPPAITEETALSLFAAAFPGRPAAITACKRGSINQIFRIESGETQYALRVRYNEGRFQYEKGVFKEALAAHLLSAAEALPGAKLDAALPQIWQRLAGRRSSEWLPFPLGAGIFHFDFTGELYPGPWAALEWTGDALGGRIAPASAFELGQLAARIHRQKFAHAYGNLHEYRPGGVDILSEWRTEILQRNHNTGGAIASAEPLAAAIGGLCAEAATRAPEFVLCHNDLHCLNVTVAGGALRLVDWDNAQIAPKELDFVKLAHWSKIGPDGHFATDTGIFASFCQGYGAAPQAVRASPLFRLAEILWLFRVLEFAYAVEAPAAAPFWPAERYAALLRERLAA
jgi:hypothetical protein